MAYKLTQAHLDIINENLPPIFVALKDRYPSTVFNAAHHWGKAKFPQGYVPKEIEIYYQESAIRPAIYWQNGQLEDVWIDEDIPANPDVMLVMVDNIWTYIRVQQQVILDRTAGIQFPPELSQHELMLRFLMRQISAGKVRHIQG